MPGCTTRPAASKRGFVWQAIRRPKPFAIKTTSATTPAAKCWSPPRSWKWRGCARYGSGRRPNGLEREWLSAAELREREPNIIGLGGIFVPSSGIVSYRDVATAMANRFQANGGEIIYHAEVSALTEHAAGVVIHTSQGREIETATLIGCAGLMADRLVKMLGVEPGFYYLPFPRRVLSSGPATQPDR
ncbi:GAB DTP gene cluster repressor [Salmonella enterica subsp. arizonae]|uniref:GAB DTP gene cluster repressor n=1 Tax=Salmonella enterica subsp. arizonae TaxID=59203 RepID=A0A379T6H7_SALER|nr:GAB DTP gene cluster repressor [Salmonella enterica subsp. arizonae]